MLFNAAEGVLISADALWERGFGVIFPELEGEHAFEDQARVLDLIESLHARWVIPGHGAPFADVAGALRIARQRLDVFRADPIKHERHAMKALVKYHLLEVQQQPLQELLDWFAAGALYAAVWQRIGRPGGTLTAFAAQIVGELRMAGVIALRGEIVFNPEGPI